MPLLALTLMAMLLFAALGVWQVERRTWKLALIERIHERAGAVPVSAPPPPRWRGITAANDEYRRIVVEGHLLNDSETLVQALTAAGPGYWVMTPLRTGDGFTVLVNRGYVPSERRGRRSRAQSLPSEVVRLTGLLRMSEPAGSLLRANRPAEERWYSRDVPAIARRRGLGPIAPYFIDADATANPGGWPLGGLTVLALPNNHLVYAITWFALALLSAYAFVVAWRGPRQGAAG